MLSLLISFTQDFCCPCSLKLFKQMPQIPLRTYAFDEHDGIPTIWYWAFFLLYIFLSVVTVIKMCGEKNNTKYDNTTGLRPRIFYTLRIIFQNRLLPTEAHFWLNWRLRFILAQTPSTSALPFYNTQPGKKKKMGTFESAQRVQSVVEKAQRDTLHQRRQKLIYEYYADTTS